MYMYVYIYIHREGATESLIYLLMHLIICLLEITHICLFIYIFTYLLQFICYFAGSLIYLFTYLLLSICCLRNLIFVYLRICLHTNTYTQYVLKYLPAQAFTVTCKQTRDVYMDHGLETFAFLGLSCFLPPLPASSTGGLGCYIDMVTLSLYKYI